MTKFYLCIKSDILSQNISAAQHQGLSYALLAKTCSIEMIMTNLCDWEMTMIFEPTVKTMKLYNTIKMINSRAQ